jgi:hypothetical protein
MTRFAIAVMIVVGAVLVVASRCAAPHPLTAPPASIEAPPGTDTAAPDETVPTTTAPTSSTVASPAATTGLAQTDTLETAVPIVAHLPHETPDWSITYQRTGTDTIALTITVHVILNNARDLATYPARSSAARAAALDYLRANGADPATLVITWVPPGAGA